MANGANTMAGKYRQRAAAQELAKRFNQRSDLQCHCKDCIVRRGAVNVRTPEERWARMQLEVKARQRKASRDWDGAE